MYRKLLVLVLVIVVVAAALVDVLIRKAMEDSAEERIRDEVSDIAGAAVDIESFPFVGRLAIGGSVPRITVTLDQVVRQQVAVAELRARIDGVTLDRGRLLDGEVLITGLDEVVVSATVVEAAFDAFTPPGVDLRFVPGRVEAVAAGVTVSAELALEGGSLRVDVEGAVPAFSVPLPLGSLLPCEPELEVGDGEIELSCTSEVLHEVLVDTISRRTG
ncbi:hypothetical protein BH20ACT2_BH20ACT2_12800 [soil metagenome]